MAENKKKILYLITRGTGGGAQHYIVDLADILKNEYEITVAFGEPGEGGDLSKLLKKAGIKYFILPHLKRSISPINDFLALLEIKKLIEELQPDIIHLNSSKISILGSLAKFLNPKSQIKNPKLIYTVHGLVLNAPISKSERLFYKYAEKFTALWKNKIICVSEFDKQSILKENIAPEQKLITIHNGRASIEFIQRNEAQKIIDEKLASVGHLQNNGQDFLIGSIGNFFKTKGFPYFIEAIHILIKKHRLPIRAIIIGEGEERKILEEKIRELKLENNFYLLGKIDNASRLLPAFDLYVSSSVKEGLPYSVIEAMQAGLPIVATKVGGISEMIEDGQEGILVDSKNPEEIAQAILKLINNPNISNKMGTAAREKALSEFTLDRMISETKKIYTNNQ